METPVPVRTLKQLGWVTIQGLDVDAVAINKYCKIPEVEERASNICMLLGQEK